MEKNYGDRSLAQKLGLEVGTAVCLLNTPEYYEELTDLETFNVKKVSLGTENCDFIHYFASNKHELDIIFPKLKASLKVDGMLWVSNPKKDSGLETDLNQNVVMEIGLKHGLVDVKICSIDANWSAMKFVYRVKDRG